MEDAFHIFSMVTELRTWVLNFFQLCFIYIVNKQMAMVIMSEFLPHLALSWNLSTAEDLASLSLQDGATKWHYYQSATHPPNQPATGPPTLKVKYLRNHWSDPTEIYNLSLWDLHTVCKDKINMMSKGRRPPIEDDLKIPKVEYFSNHYSDPPQILNWKKWEKKIWESWANPRKGSSLVKVFFFQNYFFLGGGPKILISKNCFP